MTPHYTPNAVIEQILAGSRPARIRLSRAAGWRKPAGAVVVARPSRWGNPWQVGAVSRALCGAEDWSQLPPRAGEPLWRAVHPPLATPPFGAARDRIAAETAVALYRAALGIMADSDPAGFADWLAPLRGRALCCWCALDAPCHADVLIGMSNG